MSDIYATVLIEDAGDTFIDSDGLIDGAGNRFVAWGVAVEHSNNTYVTVQKFAPSGAVLGEWTVRPTDGQKMDECVLMHSGNDLIVQIDCHAAVSEKPRRLTVESAVIPGVWVLRAGQELEEGGAGAFQPSSGGGEVSIDYERIKSDVQVIVNAAMHTTVDNILPKTRQAIDEKKVMTEAMFAGGGGSPVVYQQLVNTSYTGAMGAIRDSKP